MFETGEYVVVKGVLRRRDNRGRYVDVRVATLEECTAWRAHKQVLWENAWACQCVVRHPKGGASRYVRHLRKTEVCTRCRTVRPGGIDADAKK